MNKNKIDKELLDLFRIPNDALFYWHEAIKSLS